MQVICRRRKLRNVARKANRSEKKNKQISKHLFFILAVFCRCLDAFAISPQHLMLVAGIRSFSVRIGAKAVCVCVLDAVPAIIKRELDLVCRHRCVSISGPIVCRTVQDEVFVLNQCFR